MAAQAPGQHHRKGMTVIEAVQTFTDEGEVERLFVEARWPNGVACPLCGSVDVREIPSRKPAPFRCADCRKHFSVKTGTVMHSSNIPLRKWALASYLMSTSLKGVSSMKLHRDLGITQKSAWHMAHRIRKAWESGGGLFSGPVEFDETYVGGKAVNKHKSKKLPHQYGVAGKVAVMGAKDRETGQVALSVPPSATKVAVQDFVHEHTSETAPVFTDEHVYYSDIPNHYAVRHGAGEYVTGEVHTNGIESFWSMFKRGIVGTYHHISPKHTGRYAQEFAGRHNARPQDTIDQITNLIRGMHGKRLRYRDLIAK